MRKKALQVLLPVVMAVSVFVGCGEPQQTMGSAEGTRQEESRGVEENVSSEESKGTEDAAQPEESVASGETVQEEEPEEPKPLVLAITRSEVHGDYICVLEREEYEYDEAGNLTRKTLYDGSLKVSRIYEYEYDEAGNLTKEEACN